MGYPDSTVARWISLDAHTSLIVFVSLVALITVAIVSLFVYRCHVLIPQHHFLKINEKGHIYFSIALLFIYYFPVGAGLENISPDQAEARQWVLEKYSCAKSVIDAPNLQVYTPYTIRRLVVTAVVLGSLAAAVLLQAISLSHHFLTKPNKVSIPLFTLLIPVLFLMYMFHTSHSLFQGEGNLALCTMGLHGFTSPITLILCNDAYRDFLLKKLRCRCDRIRRKINVSATTERHIPVTLH